MLLNGLPTQIISQMLNDPRTQEITHLIDVKEDQGFITLSGSVPSEKARQAAEEIARETEGVVDVHNQLDVGT